MTSCRLGALLCLAAVAACSRMDPLPTDAPPDSGVTEPPAAPVTGIPAPTTPDGVKPAQRRSAVLIVSSGTTATYGSVAATLGAMLEEEFELDQLVLDAESGQGFLLPAEAASTTTVVAIGAPAAAYARDHFDGPVVISQVLDVAPYLVDDGRLFAVEALPPPELQLRSWQRLTGGAATVGLILGTGDAGLAAPAQAAAETLGVELIVEQAASDREVLYRFKRLARRIDGLWLMPSDEILSPTVLREVFDYARQHGVQTIVFNSALLEWGALLSISSDTSDVAATVARLVAAISRGEQDTLPRVTPLGGADVQLNPEVAAAMGLAPETSSDVIRLVERSVDR